MIFWSTPVNLVKFWVVEYVAQCVFCDATPVRGVYVYIVCMCIVYVLYERAPAGRGVVVAGDRWIRYRPGGWCVAYR